jgi:Sec-independent protein translocase protein TatA
MNFFGVGPAELIVILVVALEFVGPERLPRLAADLARTIREIRKYTGSLAAEFNEVIQDFERETEGDRSQWKEIGEGLSGATKSVTDALRGAREDAETAGAAPAGAAPTTTNGTSPAPSNGGAPDEAITPATWREIAEPEPPLPSSATPDGPAASSTNGTHAPAEAQEPR